MGEGGAASYWEYLGIVICLLFSALFSGTETAVTALPDSKAQKLLEEGGKGTRILKLWIDHPARVLATILIGNNIVNILASILAYRIADYYLGHWAEAAAVAGLTLLLLVFGEVSPKTFAVHNAERLAVPLLKVIWIFERLFYPISWLLERLGMNLVRLSRNKDEGEPPLVTEDEIEYMIDLGKREGVLEADRSEMLQSVLGFSDTMVKEAMVPRTDIFALEDTTTLQEALGKVVEKGHSRIPVFHDRLDNLVGLLYAKDLLAKIRDCASLDTLTVGQLVRKQPFFAVKTMKLSKLLKEMRARRLHMAIVVDEFGGTAGLITLEDLLEEIVGDIQDEFEHEQRSIVKLNPHTYIVDAKVFTRDLSELLGFEFPEQGDYETLGGFLSLHAGRIPERGHVIHWRGVVFTVTAADERRVITVEVRLPADMNGPPA